MRDPDSERLLRAIGVLAVLAAALALAIVPLLPGSAEPDPPADRFSTVRALELVERIATEPRPIGSPGNARARAVIVAELERLGLGPELQATEAPDWFGTAGGASIPVVNVLARIPGTDATRAVALVGHIDTPPDTPGANDDAAAIAAILEVARVLRSGPPLSGDVILLFTDGEEPTPRFGASAFIADHAWAAEIDVLVNLEAIGSEGPVVVVAIDHDDAVVLDAYAAAVERPAAFSFLTATRDLVGGATSDLEVFRAAGIPGIELAYFRGSPIYHTAADTLERVDPDSLQHLGDSTLALARELAGRASGDPSGDAPEVFHAVSRVLVRYPAAWTALVVLAAGLAIAVAGILGARADPPVRRSRIGLGLLRAVVSVAAVTTVGTILWILIAGSRDDPGALEAYLYLGLLVALAVVVHVGVSRLAGQSSDPSSAAIALAALWWLLAALVVVATPLIGYVFALPALAAGAALLVRGPVRRDRGSVGAARELVSFAIVAVTTLVLVVPAIDTFFQFAQPRPGNPGSQLIWMVAIPMLLIALTVELLAAARPRGAGPSTGAA